MSVITVKQSSSTQLGAYIQQQETQVFSEVVSDIFGFHAVQYGWQSTDLLMHSRIPNKYYLTHASLNGLESAETLTNLMAESEFLPFAENTLDLLCLPHTLEQCAHPQQSLREAYRVLVADGTLVLTGITPVSLLGLSARFAQCHGLGNILRQFSAWRIRDWLGVLGFEMVNSGYCMHALPINDNRWLQRQTYLERWGPATYGMTGAIYYIVAKKRVINVRLLKPEWRSKTLGHALPARKAHSPSQKQ